MRRNRQGKSKRQSQGDRGRESEKGHARVKRDRERQISTGVKDRCGRETWGDPETQEEIWGMTKHRDGETGKKKYRRRIPERERHGERQRDDRRPGPEGTAMAQGWRDREKEQEDQQET